MTPVPVTLSVAVQVAIAVRVAQIAEHSVRNAIEWDARLRAALQMIGEVPGLCRIDVDASRRAGLTVRKLVFEKTYLAFYAVDPVAGVEVVGFRHGARQPGPHEP